MSGRPSIINLFKKKKKKKKIEKLVKKNKNR